MRRSPSPLPTAWGKGSTLPASIKALATGSVTAAFNHHAGTAVDSFSPREKDRMRGKNTRNARAAPFFLCLANITLPIKT